jgi:hypothetical protein
MAGIYVSRGGPTWDNVGRTELKVNIGGSTWVNPRRVYVNRGGTNWGSPIWVYDETAPSGGTINALAWSDVHRGFSVSYSSVSDESGIAEYSLQYSTNNSSFTGIGSLSTSGGVFSHTLPLGDRNGNVWYRAYMRDTVGNERVSTISFGGTRNLMDHSPSPPQIGTHGKQAQEAVELHGRATTPDSHVIIYGPGMQGPLRHGLTSMVSGSTVAII